MTNREKYKQAFAVLHPSAGSSLEESHMNYRSRKIRTRAAALLAACLLLGCAGGIAYAADVGGIQRTIQLWMKGEQTAVVFQYDPDGSYTLSYPDQTGGVAEQGGGVAIEDDGSERPLTEAELLETLREPSVEFEEDGSVWVYYLDQKIEITDRFENDICYVTVTGGGDTFYLTIHSQGEWILSPYKYPEPDFDAVSADRAAPSD